MEYQMNLRKIGVIIRRQRLFGGMHPIAML